MTVSGALRKLADVVDGLEAAVDVVDASTSERDLVEGDRVALDLAVTTDVFKDALAECAEVDAENVSIADDGTVTADLSIAVPVDGNDAAGRDPEGEAVKAESPGVEGDDVENTVDEDAIESNGSHSGRETDSPGVKEEPDTPVHRDPEKLRAVYEEYDTFDEMTEALGADVTAQTVRRQMIDHGIHEPASGGKSGEAEVGSEARDEPETDGEEGDAVETTGDEGQTTIADGIDLPAATTLEELKRVVGSARTLYDVQRELGIDRERARRLLSELDLLDLVSGRLAEREDVPIDEIERRIEEAAPGVAG